MHIVDFNSSQMPEVSVIMANFNGSRWLVDAIRSVQNQTALLHKSAAAR